MLREGDHVRVRVSLSRVRAGAIGTIRHAFRSVSDTYSVQLDTDLLPCILPGIMLERVTEEREQPAED